MFATLKARLIFFACGVWIFGAYLLANDPDSPSRFVPNYVFGLMFGWLALAAGIYGAFWVVEGGKGPVVALPPNLPRWAGYTLIAIMAILIMGLPKALFG